MLFFGLMLIATLVARYAHVLLTGRTPALRASMRWGMAAALLFVGVDHQLTPERYLSMMPSFVPHPLDVVHFTGICEIAGAIGLLVPSTRRLAGIMLAIYFVCVFPANIKNAVEGLSVDGLPTAQWYYWVRLLFQPIAILWALYAADVTGTSRQPAGMPGKAGLTVDTVDRNP